MLIKIEDFPNGKSIKHITIDISFDEDGTPQTKVNQDYEVSPIPKHSPKVYQPSTAPYIAPDHSHPAIVDPHIAIGTTTGTTAIPKEMTDLEF